MKPASSIPTLRVKFWEPIGTIVEKLTTAFDEHGDIIRLKGWPVNAFCFRKPEHIGQVLTHKTAGGTKFSQAIPRVQWLMGTGAYIMKGGPAWREKRKQIQPAFANDVIARYADQIPAITAWNIDRWNNAAETGEPFDIWHEMQMLFSDLSVKVFFGKDLGDELEHVVHLTHSLEHHFITLCPKWLSWTPFFGNSRFYREGKELRAIFSRIVEERKAGPAPESRDVLSLLLELRHQDTGQPWTVEEIVGEMFSVYFGAIVMGTTLSWTFWALGTQRDIQEKLRAEAEGVLQGRTPTSADLGEMPYCELVFKEVLRRFPASFAFPKYAEDSVQIAGYQLPAKSLLLPMVYHTHLDPRIWDDPMAFKPERFDPANGVKIDTFAYFPFGAGQRKCLGYAVAPSIIKLLILTILDKYDVEFHSRFPGDPISDIGFENWPADKVMVKVHRRESAVV